MNNTYEVEKYLKYRFDKEGKRTHVRVKWKGFPKTFNSWEPIENIIGAGKIAKRQETKKRKREENLVLKRKCKKNSAIEISLSGE